MLMLTIGLSSSKQLAFEYPFFTPYFWLGGVVSKIKERKERNYIKKEKKKKEEEKEIR